jgi:hypothetical protein
MIELLLKCPIPSYLSKYFFYSFSYNIFGFFFFFISQVCSIYSLDQFLPPHTLPILKEEQFRVKRLLSLGWSGVWWGGEAARMHI